MAGDPSHQTVAQEFGRGGKSVFEELLDPQFAEGRKQAAEKRAEADAQARIGGRGK